MEQHSFRIKKLEMSILNNDLPITNKNYPVPMQLNLIKTNNKYYKLSSKSNIFKKKPTLMKQLNKQFFILSWLAIFISDLKELASRRTWRSILSWRNLFRETNSESSYSSQPQTVIYSRLKGLNDFNNIFAFLRFAFAF